MKAKCPHCTDGCEHCQQGYVEAKLAEGDLFTIHCLKCGFDNGGLICEGFPSEPSGECVMCNGQTEWKFVCMV